MKKLYKSSRIKNHKITKKKFFDGVPLKGYIRSLLTHFHTMTPFEAREKQAF